MIKEQLLLKETHAMQILFAQMGVVPEQSFESEHDLSTANVTVTGTLVLPASLVAVIEAMNVPAAAGVPPMVPLELMLKPVGKDPDVTW